MKRRGFTLFETLIAVAVMALLAALVVTTASSTGGQSLESVARVVAADLRLARAQAVHYNTEWSVRFDVGGNRYELVHTGAGDPPPLVNPLHPERETYLVDVGELGSDSGGDNGIRLLAVQTAGSNDAVGDVAFGPLGGTGPARSEDTLIVLVERTGGGTRAVQLTVSWVTGHVWISELIPLNETMEKDGPERILEEVEHVLEAETLP